jgi:type 1 glutamine amidotransferase
MASLWTACLVALAAQDGFEPIFDGKSLEGWDGDPKFWRVEDGAITGQTTAENPTKGNTFIVWRRGEVADFEMKVEYRIVGGNSGVQYRSFEVPDQKWVIGGYQADLEAGDTWSGTLYGERFRGILAARGQKTVIGEDGKPKETGKTGESKELQKAIRKEDWNEYHIVARGFHFTHHINGQLMIESTDEDASDRRASGLVALQLHAGPPMKVQFRNIRLKRLAGGGGGGGAPGKKVVFVAGPESHGKGDHEHRAGCILLAKGLVEAMPGWQTTVVTEGWPEDESVFEGADAVVFYADGGGGHYANKRLEKIDALMKRGVGLVCIHYAVEVPKGPSGEKFLDWIGGYFELNWSVNPHWTADYQKFPDHPVARGVAPFKINDEWYYHMRFRPQMKGVTPILSAHPPKETLKRPDGGHSGNPDVRAAVERGEIQHTAWAAEREGGGRGFGFTGGHVHANWANDNHRKVVLNAVVWVAKGEVPAGGVSTATPSAEEMDKWQDHHGKLDRRVFVFSASAK